MAGGVRGQALIGMMNGLGSFMGEIGKKIPIGRGLKGLLGGTTAAGAVGFTALQADEALRGENSILGRAKQNEASSNAAAMSQGFWGSLKEGFANFLELIEMFIPKANFSSLKNRLRENIHRPGQETLPSAVLRAVGDDPTNAAIALAGPGAGLLAGSLLFLKDKDPNGNNGGNKKATFGQDTNGPHDGGSGGGTPGGNGGGDAPRGGNGGGSTTVKSTRVSENDISGKTAGIEAAEDAATHGAAKAGAKRTFLSKMFRGAASFKGNALVTGGLALGAGGYSLLSGASNAEAAEAAADTLGYGETMHNLREGNDTEAVHSATTATTSLAGGVAGAGLGMAWGAAAGSVVPVAGTFVGGLAGGIVGGIAGSGAGSIVGEAAYTAGSYIAGGISSLFNSKANPAAAAELVTAPTIHRDTGLTFGF